MPACFNFLYVLASPLCPASSLSNSNNTLLVKFCMTCSWFLVTVEVKTDKQFLVINKLQTSLSIAPSTRTIKSPYLKFSSS